MLGMHSAIGIGALVLGLLLVPWLAGHNFGPRSSAVVALVLFGGMLGLVVLWRRFARRDIGAGGTDEG